jgi:hypothetical protein
MRFQRLGAALCALALPFASHAARADVRPFSWQDATTVSVTTGASSAAVALQGMPSGQAQVRIVSTCASVVFVRKGGSAAVTATAADMPIAPGEVEVMTLIDPPSNPTTYLAMISPSGSCTVYFTIGAGG